MVASMRVLLCFTALALVVLGCGSGSDGDNPGPATTEKNSHGEFTGDAGATYHLLNRICAGRPLPTGWRSTLESR
jgi:hypothetical protein